jgi:hypothetical protein
MVSKNLPQLPLIKNETNMEAGEQAQGSGAQSPTKE